MKWWLLFLASCTPIPSPGTISVPLGSHLQIEAILTGRLHFARVDLEPEGSPLVQSAGCSGSCADLAPSAAVGLVLRYRTEF